MDIHIHMHSALGLALEKLLNEMTSVLLNYIIVYCVPSWLNLDLFNCRGNYYCSDMVALLIYTTWFEFVWF
jgi:hypothetical protein